MFLLSSTVTVLYHTLLILGFSFFDPSCIKSTLISKKSYLINSTCVKIVFIFIIGLKIHTFGFLYFRLLVILYKGLGSGLEERVIWSIVEVVVVVVFQRVRKTPHHSKAHPSPRLVAATGLRTKTTNNTSDGSWRPANKTKTKNKKISSIRTFLTWRECTELDLSLFVRDCFSFLAK